MTLRVPLKRGANTINVQDESHQTTPAAGCGYKIEQRITIASSPSAILEGIKRYFDKRGSVLHLIVPLKNVGSPGTLALERPVAVELKAKPNRAGQQGRLEFRWFPAGESTPSFIGSFEVTPHDHQTELVLVGDYRPPFEAVVPEFGAVFDYETAQDTGRLLLEELKAVLETESDVVDQVIRSGREELERAGPIPQVGWRASRERFW